jgi:small subunit ribosomal protein S6e
VKAKEQATEYAKLLAVRQKEAKDRRLNEKRRRSASMRDSKSSSQAAPTK